MRECENIDVRDRLPDLLHERLSVAERERVLAHVSGCADCAADLAWLRSAREAITASGPRVNVAAIASAVSANVGRPATLRVVDGGASRPTVAARPRSLWRSAQLRAAAAVAIVAAGTAGVIVAGREGPAPREAKHVETAAPSSAGSASVPVAATVQPAPTAEAAVPNATAASRAGRQSAPPAQVASASPTPLGSSFSDLSDEELAAVIRAVDADGGKLPADPAPTPGVITPGGEL